MAPTTASKETIKAPEITKATVTTKTLETSQASEITTAQATTKAPKTTKAPETTEASEITKATATTKAPETSQASDQDPPETTLVLKTLETTVSPVKVTTGRPQIAGVTYPLPVREPSVIESNAMITFVSGLLISIIISI